LTCYHATAAVGHRSTGTEGPLSVVSRPNRGGVNERPQWGMRTRSRG